MEKKTLDHPVPGRLARPGRSRLSPVLAGKSATKTQTHRERREETYRGKERMKESDTETERDKEIWSSRKLEAGERERERERESERGLGGLPGPDWPRLTAIKACN